MNYPIEYQAALNETPIKHYDIEGNEITPVTDIAELKKLNAKSSRFIFVRENQVDYKGKTVPIMRQRTPFEQGVDHVAVTTKGTRNKRKIRHAMRMAMKAEETL